MTSDSQTHPQKYCEHWVVCKHAHALLYCPVDATGENHKECEYDTRTHSSTPAPDAMSDQDKHAYAEAYNLGRRDGAKAERERFLPILERLTKALYKYEQDVMDFDFPPPSEHRDMMEIAEKVLESLRQPEPQQEGRR